jgi:hypothetical protein
MTREEAIAVLSDYLGEIDKESLVGEALTLALSALSGNAEGWVLVPRDRMMELAREIKANAEDHSQESMSRFALLWADELAATVISAAPQPTTAIPAREGE